MTRKAGEKGKLRGRRREKSVVERGLGNLKKEGIICINDDRKKAA